MSKTSISNKILLVFLFVFFMIEVNAQVKEFSFFVPINRYEERTKEILKTNQRFKNYKYFGNYYIDRSKKGIINYSNVDEGLKTIIPLKNDNNYLCVNIENELYRNVRDLDSDDPKFKKSLKELVSLIKYIKRKRPNLKVGFYGIPYNFYYIVHKKRNTDKFLSLLKQVDFISPHLYIHYPDIQKGQNANINYLKQNMQLALEYGKKLKKPVIPYVWYIIHPANKIYGGQLITKEEMAEYLKTIESYNYCGQKIEGVIWWEPSVTKYKIPKKHLGKIKSNMSKDEILIEYVNTFQKQNDKK